VTVFEIGQDGDVLYIVSQFLEGETLADRLARAKDRGLPIDDALKIEIEIAGALDRAHRAGLVHRDLKASKRHVDEGGGKAPRFRGWRSRVHLPQLWTGRGLRSRRI
jgi:serine/threonine-protein kinase